MIETISYLAGGLGLFLYGLDLASQGLQKAIAGPIRQLLCVFTRNRFAGLLIGILLTICFQSSTATTVLLVGLVKASILNLQQTLGVILGSDIGTTFTVQLIAFKFDLYSLLIFAVGVLLLFLSRYEKTRNWARALMGFGLLFYGMVLMKTGMAPLHESPSVMKCLVMCEEMPWLLLLASIILTALIHSSAATIAIAIALVSSPGNGAEPLLSFTGAVPIIFGANIGTCATAFLAALPADRRARQVAVAHFFFKAAAVALIFPFLTSFTDAVEFLSRQIAAGEVGPARLLANAHTLFNVAAALAFLPFTQWVGPLLEWFYPAKAAEKLAPRGIVLTEELAKTPSMAFEEAEREIVKMGQDAQYMFTQARTAFEREDSYLIEDIWRADQTVDARYAALSKYLSRLSRASLTEAEAKRIRDCFLVVEELEHIGDIVAKNLVPLASKKLEKGVDFSMEGFHDIMKLHELVRQALEQILKAFQEKNKEAAQLWVGRKHEISDRTYQMRLNHLERLKKGLKESLETSSIHLDVLSSLSQVFYHVLGIARVVAQA